MFSDFVFPVPVVNIFTSFPQLFLAIFHWFLAWTSMDFSYSFSSSVPLDFEFPDYNSSLSVTPIDNDYDQVLSPSTINSQLSTNVNSATTSNHTSPQISPSDSFTIGDKSFPFELRLTDDPIQRLWDDQQNEIEDDNPLEFDLNMSNLRFTDDKSSIYDNENNSIGIFEMFSCTPEKFISSADEFNTSMNDAYIDDLNIMSTNSNLVLDRAAKIEDDSTTMPKTCKESRKGPRTRSSKKTIVASQIRNLKLPNSTNPKISKSKVLKPRGRSPNTTKRLQPAKTRRTTLRSRKNNEIQSLSEQDPTKFNKKHIEWIKLTPITEDRLMKIRSLAKSKNMNLHNVNQVLNLFQQTNIKEKVLRAIDYGITDQLKTKEGNNSIGLGVVDRWCVNEDENNENWLEIGTSMGKNLTNEEDENRLENPLLKVYHPSLLGFDESSSSNNGSASDKPPHSVMSASQLKKQKRKGPNYIKRPLNSFMLYRKFQIQAAYIYAIAQSSTIYEEQLQNNASKNENENENGNGNIKPKSSIILDIPKLNHQSISQMISLLWNTEFEEIKLKFSNFASFWEKEIHKVAYPSYKFQPQKKQPKNK